MSWLRILPQPGDARTERAEGSETTWRRLDCRPATDWFISLALAIPFVGLGTAIVRDYRGLRSSFCQPRMGPPSEAAERRYGGVIRLVGWVFIVLLLYPLVAETIRLFV
ncbi:hypothetical protein GCM10022207_86800 [Streptomyces lannensis]|uniref:CD225/dispanin family protein n=1 Tax=Streptomyces lannensis TaxID=766498 RepID=A0ABP7LR35_9ACTN